MQDRKALFAWIAIVLFLFIAYFPLFWRLDSKPLIGWDESLFAMRAHYLAEHGTLMKTFAEYPGMGDYPNNKPPFTTTIQAASLKIFGYNELALRLPIALLGLATLVLMLYFSKRLFGQVYPGILAGLLLITMENYVDFHAVRTGDHDAALAFYMLVQVLSFFAYTQQRRTSYLLLFLGATTAAFLTKSLVAFFFFPAFLLYLLYKKSLVQYLRTRSTYLALAFLIVLVVGYYWLMERYIPGFWDLTRNHTLGRYTEPLRVDWDRKPFEHYLLRIWEKCRPAVFLLPLAWLAGFGSATRRVKDLTFLLTASSLSHLLIISLSQTKYDWYDIPVLPLLAFLGEIGLYYFFWEIKRFTHFPPIALAAFLLFALFFFPYRNVLIEIKTSKIWDPSDKVTYLMKRNDKQSPAERISSFTVSLSGRSNAAAFYGKIFESRSGYQIDVTSAYDSFRAGEYVMSCEDRNLAAIEQYYTLEVIDQHEACQFVKILGRQSDGAQ